MTIRSRLLLLLVPALVPALTLEPSAPVPTSPQYRQDEQDKQKKQDREPPTRLDPAQDCTTKCHQNLTQRRLTHAPITKGNCAVCHPQPAKDKHEFEEVDDINETCLSCHKMHLAKTVHEPVVESDCTACHDPHGSTARALLVRDQPGLCATCHADQVADTRRKHVHGPAATGKCSLCHEAHSADVPKLLTEKPRSLCLSCHEEVAAKLATDEHIHDPVKTDCAKCHDAHGSDHPYQLHEDTSTMCLDCHKVLKKKLDGAHVRHGALDTGKKCLNCHTPHSAKFPHLLDSSVKASCVKCHDKPVPREGRQPVAAISKLIGKKKFLHGPIREDDCTECHQAHAATTFSLLEKEYPKHFYADYEKNSYELCFDCHDRKVFETENTGSLTKFRSGDRNLHYLHVTRKKGRTCRACHDVHGSDNPFHLAEKVRFGKWMMPMNFERTPTGGSCAPGCHKLAKYERGIVKPVDMKRR